MISGASVNSLWILSPKESLLLSMEWGGGEVEEERPWGFLGGGGFGRLPPGGGLLCSCGLFGLG